MQTITPRISRLDRNQVTAETGEIYDRYMQQRGNVPNMFRTVAHRPEILQTMIAHFEAILHTGTLPLKLKELAIVRTSQLNRSDYCLASHSRICKKLGWNDDQLIQSGRLRRPHRFHPPGKSGAAAGGVDDAQ